MAAAVRARILVTGIVQGVGYRASCREEGTRLALSGWVRNLPDGRVEALCEGPRERVESLVAWCWRGPPLARVSQVEVAWAEPEGGLEPFRTLR